MSAPSLISKKTLFHRHLVIEILKSWQEIFSQSKYADKVIEKNLKDNRKWGSRDRKFYAENVYEGVRWWRKYWALLGQEPLLEMDALFRIWGIHQLLQGQQLPDWKELAGLKLINKNLPLAINESVPDWLFELGQQELGDRWPSILKSLNQKSTVDLRTNTLKTNRQKLQQELLKEGIETILIDDQEEALSLIERKNVFITESFKQGFFEVQDRASQRVAHLLNPQPGERVIDACAGSGGKSLHLASLMKNKGKIIALDIHEWKLKELLKRANRNGITIIETRVIDSTKTVKRLVESADRILLDVPCTGLGVLRRNPDSKWKLKPEEINKTLEMQKGILEGYAKMLKPGGCMVYSTCSILPSENEKQIEWFMSRNPGWRLESMTRIDPDQGKGDGFFMALLVSP